MPPNLQAVLPLGVSSSALARPPGRGHRILVGSAIVLGLAAILFAMLHGDLFRAVRQAIEAAHLSASVLKPSLILASMGLLMLALRTLLWFSYRPFEPATYEWAPTMTVVIPAYNEGAMVEQSIESVAAARYPHGRLEILVVDDGSTDDTWTYIQRAAARHPGPVEQTRMVLGCAEEDRILGAADQADSAQVGQEAGREDQRRLPARERRQLALEGLVEVEVTVQEPRAGAARAVAVQCVVGSLEDFRMVGQPQVIVRSQHDHTPAIDRDDGTVRGREHVEKWVEAGGLDQLRFPIAVTGFQNVHSTTFARNRRMADPTIFL